MPTWILRALVIAVLALSFGGLMSFFGEPRWSLAIGGAVMAYLLVATTTKATARSLFLAPFKEKSRVLAGAHVIIHSIEAADRNPKGQDEASGGEEECEPVDCFIIEATITPVPNDGAFEHWEPAEIVFIDHRMEVGDLDEDEGPEGWIEELSIDRDGVWIGDEAAKYVGSLKLRMKALVPRSFQRVKLRYYFETFGDLRLPCRKEF